MRTRYTQIVCDSCGLAEMHQRGEALSVAWRKHTPSGPNKPTYDVCPACYAEVAAAVERLEAAIAERIEEV